MARTLILKAKNSGKEIRLILGETKSDMSLSPDERRKKVGGRISRGLNEVKKHMEENKGDELVVRGTGQAD